MELKVNIGLLEGKLNWDTWTYKVIILIKSVLGVEKSINVEFLALEPLNIDAFDDDIKNYDEESKYFTNANTKAVLIQTTKMTEEN